MDETEPLPDEIAEAPDTPEAPPDTSAELSEIPAEPLPEGATFDREYVRQVLDVTLRIGSLMLASQAGTADTSATMSAITAAYGLRNTQTDVTSTTIVLSVPRGVRGAPLTSMWHVEGRSLDYTRLFNVIQLAQRVADERPELKWAHHQLDRVERAAHPYPRWVSTLSLGTMAAAFSVLLGAGPAVALIALVTTAVIDRVGRVLNQHGVPMLFQMVVSGMIATAVTVSLDALHLLPKGSAPSLIVAANIMALLSGMAMVSSVQDAINGYPLTSVGRLLEIVISTVGIFMGIGVAIRIGIALHIDVSVTANVSASWLGTPVRVAAGMVGAAAAAVASYAPVRGAVAAGIAGIFGTLTYIAMTHVGAGRVASAFIAAAAIGFIGSMAAGRLRVPMLMVAMSGIVPLVPGFTLYKGFVTLFNGHQAQGVGLLVTAAGMALALAGGVVLGPLLAPATLRELRRVRRIGKEMGPKVDNRWIRTPTFAGIDVRKIHYMPPREVVSRSNRWRRTRRGRVGDG